MEILPPSPALSLQSTDPAAWLATLDDRSAVSEQVVLRRPLAEVVQAALAAAGSESENTARNYVRAIGAFLIWLSDDLAERLPADWNPLAERNLVDDSRQRRVKSQWSYRGQAAVLRAVTAASLDNFVVAMQNAGMSRTSARNARQAVVTFMRVAYRDGILTERQAQQMAITPYKHREHRFAQPVGRRLSPDEVRALRAVVLRARTDGKRYRDLAIMDCMLYMGLRRETVARLAPENLVQDAGRWWVIVETKGQKTIRQKVHDVLFKSLDAWIKYSGLTWGEGAEPMFSNLNKAGRATGHELDASVIGRLVAEYGNLAGLAPMNGPNCLSPHDLRRTAARNAYDHGATIYQVQAMLGHSSVETTQRYIGALTDDSNTAIDKISY